jgi:hypothetical protein
MSKNNATAFNKTILDDATETETSKTVVTIKSIKNAGGTNEQSIVDRYALVKHNVIALQLEMIKLEKELQEIEDKAITYAKENRVSILYGKDYSLRVTEQEKIKYPYAKDPGRKELEELVKQTGIWESVSALNLLKLQKYLKDNMFNKKLVDAFSRFAVMVKKTKVSLIRRMDR